MTSKSVAMTTYRKSNVPRSYALADYFKTYPQKSSFETIIEDSPQ